jgi:glycosyltransferase involved in cell wall biosynthesis
MKVAMFTNTYLPHVGGVAESVNRLSEDCRERGHQVCVVAPRFPKMPDQEHYVIRVPAIQNFNGSDFSVSLPAPFSLSKALDDFKPEIIHTHHPYLLGDTALRVSATRDLPLILTYHTMYEQYTHYVPVDSPRFKRFVIELAIRFANLCDHVIAPSESIAQILKTRGVTAPMTVIPTGVDCAKFSNGDGKKIREQMNIPQHAFVVGHVGRLAPEKNLIFLAQALVTFLQKRSNVHCLIIGDGPSAEDMQAIFTQSKVQSRVHFAGIQRGSTLIDHYHAMDVFAFASKTETQGMVLAEAMAAGVPVIALEAPGVREIIKDQYNGCMLNTENIFRFALTLEEMHDLSKERFQAYKHAAVETAGQFSRDSSVTATLKLYEQLCTMERKSRQLNYNTWDSIRRIVKQEWEIWVNRISAGIEALSD